MNSELTKQNIKYYDTEAEVYDESRYTSTKGRRIDLFQKRLLAKHLSELPVNSKVLEFGCGTGRFLSYLLDIGYELTGVDISEGMLEKAHTRVQTKSKTAVKLLHNDSDILPFDDEEFDAVY